MERVLQLLVLCWISAGGIPLCYSAAHAAVSQDARRRKLAGTWVQDEGWYRALLLSVVVGDVVVFGCSAVSFAASGPGSGSLNRATSFVAQKVASARIEIDRITAPKERYVP